MAKKKTAKTKGAEIKLIQLLSHDQKSFDAAISGDFTAAAKNLGIGGIDLLSKLAETLGPLIMKLLLQWLASKEAARLLKTRRGGKAAFAPSMNNILEVRSFLLMLIRRFGPSLITKLADQLKAKPDWLS